MTVNELDERMDTLRGQLRKAKEELVTMTNDASVEMADVRSKKQAVADLQERLSILEEQKKALMKVRRNAPREKMTMKEARGVFYRHVLNDGEAPAAQDDGGGSDDSGAGDGGSDDPVTEAYQQLGAIPANSVTQGYGDKLLPKQMARDLILEPEIKNPLREHMTVTQIVGLELPKLLFDLSDDDYMDADGETAKELAMSAGTVAFGRHKMHLVAKVSESLLRATPLAIEGAIDSALQSALANKELKVMFAADPAQGEEDMSFYAQNVSEEYVIKGVEGATMLDAIVSAYADLEDIYRANARVCMRYVDYAAMLRDLSNSDNLFGRKPEEIFGIPAIWCDKATIPVVGDFGYLQENFDMAPWFDTDKDLIKGLRLFDCTAQYDIKRRMDAAFRLAIVAEEAADDN